MIKIKFIIIILLLFVNINVFAICDTTKLKELKSIANKIEFTYDYDFVHLKNSDDGRINDVVFKIKAYNLNPEIKPLIIKDYYTDDFKEFKYSATGSSLSGFKEGEKIHITFKAYTVDDCSGLTIATKTISLPYFNWYYQLPVCEGNRDFKYCKTEFLNFKLNPTVFGNELRKYEEDKKNINDTHNEIEKTISINEIMIFIIMILVILILVIVIILVIKRKLKKRSL